MKIQITKKIGDTTAQFVIEEPKDVDALFQAGCVASMPTICSECGSSEVELSGNKADGYTFVKVHCKSCNANSTMGQYKDGGFFWKKFERFTPKETASAVKEATTPSDYDNEPF